MKVEGGRECTLKTQILQRLRAHKAKLVKSRFLMLLFYIILFDDWTSTYETFESYYTLFLSKTLSHLNHMPLKRNYHR